MHLENFSYLIPNELAGMAYPYTGLVALEELVERGFRSVVALGEPVPARAPVELAILQRDVPDFSRVAPEVLDAAVVAIRDAPRPVVVCCSAGIGRTGMVLACYLVSLGRTAHGAIDEVRTARPGSIDHPLLELSVYDYFQFINSPKRISLPNGPPNPARSNARGDSRKLPTKNAGSGSPSSSIADATVSHRSVFLMMRYREGIQYRAVERAICSTLEGYSLELSRADWKQVDELLWCNVRQHMQSSFYGIAVFETLADTEVSPNVCLELGYMLALNRPCLLLKERTVRQLHADLAGHLCKEFDETNIDNSVREAVTAWLREIGIAKAKTERLLVFVSSGGTCRDPMAKAIFQQMLCERAPHAAVRVEAMAMQDPNGPTASDAARRAIHNMYGSDLLAQHRTARLTNAIEAEANLILVMERSMLKQKEPSGKRHLLRKFVGLDGDVIDPWPSTDDAASLQRYRECAAELKQALENGWEQLAAVLFPGQEPR